jgi:hypothetical protein
MLQPPALEHGAARADDARLVHQPLAWVPSRQPKVQTT